MKSDSRDRVRSWKFLGRLVVGVGGLIATGCQSSDESPPHQVWGKITHNGEPVHGGVIILMPATGMAGSWGIGTIEPDGVYTLSSSQNRPMIAAGRYGVSFSPLPDGKPVDPAHAIPEKYTDSKHPVFSIDLGNQPLRVDITLRD